jgi:hypothetical protein
MCEHCGCRGVAPNARLMDAHLELLDSSGEVRRRLADGIRQPSHAALRQVTDLLARHVPREEAGVFAAPKAEGDYAEAVAHLDAEHRDSETAIASFDVEEPNLRARMDVLLPHLELHIENDNPGVSPVPVVTLRAAGWEMVAHAEIDRTPVAPPTRCATIAPPHPHVTAGKTPGRGCSELTEMGRGAQG